jgi:hypothetical protein
MLNTRGRPQKMGSRRGELARSQALLRASIAMSAARRCVPVAEGPPTGAYVRVRPAALRRRDQNGGRLLWVDHRRPVDDARSQVCARSCRSPLEWQVRVGQASLTCVD